MQKKICPITTEEHRDILAATNNFDLRLYLEILWDTGSRPYDILRLRAEDVDRDRQQLVIVTAKTAASGLEPLRIPISTAFERDPRATTVTGFIFESFHNKSALEIAKVLGCSLERRGRQGISPFTPIDCISSKL